MRLSLVALPLVLTGCASIFSGTKDYITITSYPSDARVLVVERSRALVISNRDGFPMRLSQPGSAMFTTRTPAQLTLSKSGEWVVQIEKAGYEPEIRTLTKTGDPLAWLNLLNPMIGWIIDMRTGAIYQADPTEYHVVLRRAGG